MDEQAMSLMRSERITVDERPHVAHDADARPLLRIQAQRPRLGQYAAIFLRLHSGKIGDRLTK